MKKLDVLSGCLILVLLSCKQIDASKKEEPMNDSISFTKQIPVKDEVHQKDSIISDTTSFSPDTIINSRLILWNSESVYKYLGDLNGKLNDYDTASSDVYFKNKKGEQYLQLIQLPGSSPNTITIFEVGFTRNIGNVVKIHASSISEFKTGKGIGLGVSKEFIIDKMGNDYVERKDMSGYHMTYNHEMDGLYYTAIYYFQDDQLVKFRFGYDNP